MEDMFYFIYKIIFGINKEQDDIRSAYLYFNFFHETVNSQNLETANHIAQSFSCFIVLGKHTCRPIKTHILSKLFYN